MIAGSSETRTYPTRVELAGFYAEDAFDFLRRFKLAFYSNQVDFQGKKSRRAKAYVDLRMAVEALLKSIICLRSPWGLAGRSLVRMVRQFSHDINTLKESALKGIELKGNYSNALDKCSMAPVDLRYQFDAMNFRSGDDQEYYETIGSDAWLGTLEEFLDLSLERLQSTLNRRSKILKAGALLGELQRLRDY